MGQYVAGVPSARATLSFRIGTILSARAMEAGISQTQIATAVGISQSQVSKLFRGAAVFEVDVMDACCTAVGADIVAVVAEAKAS